MKKGFFLEKFFLKNKLLLATKAPFVEKCAKKSVGQGTIEYLIIIAVVVVLALLVVGFMAGFFSSGASFSGSSNEVSSVAGLFSIKEAFKNPDGNYGLLISSNLSESVSVKSISLGGFEVYLTALEPFFLNQEKGYVIPSSISCSIGEKIQHEVIINYVTPSGLEKSVTYPQKISFPCQSSSLSPNVTSSTGFGKELNPSGVFPSTKASISSGLVGLWHLNDKNSDGWLLNSATGIWDGNLNVGADVNSAGLWDTNAAWLYGATDYAAVGRFQFASEATFSIWFKSTNISAAQMVFGGTIFCYSYNSGGVRCATDGGSVGNPTFGGNKHDGNWHHLVLTTDGDLAKAYIDGVFGEEWNETMSTTSSQYDIGRLTSGTYNFRGAIDEFAIWSRELSADEVKDLYEFGAFRLD